MGGVKWLALIVREKECIIAILKGLLYGYDEDRVLASKVY